MPDYSCIFFDLDGTLTDPGLGITNSVMYALERFGIHTEDRSTLYKYIGPPLFDSFREFHGFSDDDARTAIDLYREYFSAKGLFENELIPGIPALLQRLRNAGKQLFVATSKPEDFSLKILEHFDLLQYFDFVAGSCMDETRTQKWEVVQWALEHCSCSRDQILMVGDRHHDVEGSARCGLPCLGVLFGYGTREELLGAGAVAVAATPEEIGAFILGK